MKQNLRLGHCYAFFKALFITTILISSMCAEARAQRPEPSGPAPGFLDSIKPLEIGDTIPEPLWHLPLQVVNHPEGKDTITLNDFRGKLIILDFWATWCTSCIHSLPSLYQLQQKFKDDVIIQLVSAHEHKPSDVMNITRFLEERKPTFSFSSIVSDTVLSTLFEHRSIPHYVWIHNDTLAAITGSSDINEAAVEAVLDGRANTILPKQLLDWDGGQPLFDEATVPVSRYLHRSTLTDHIPRLRTLRDIVHNPDSTVSRIYGTNCTVKQLYFLAYPEYRRFANSYIVSESRNRSKFHSTQLYNYELICPPSPAGIALHLMRQDLHRYFSLILHVERRNMECLVLKVRGNPERPDPNSRPESNLSEPLKQPRYLKNKRIGLLVRHLNGILHTPVIDETGYSGNVNLDLPADLTDEPALRDSLARQGFELARKRQIVEVLVISEHIHKSN